MHTNLTSHYSLYYFFVYKECLFWPEIRLKTEHMLSPLIHFDITHTMNSGIIVKAEFNANNRAANTSNCTHTDTHTHTRNIKQ